MQDHFIHASKDSPLPVAYPETFLPDIWKTPFKDIDLETLKGPIVALADCCSWEPKGPVKVLAERLPHVREFYELRIRAEADSPFCHKDTMNTLGTLVKLTGPGPDVFLVFNTLFHLGSSSDPTAELKEAREKAPPELREMLTKNNHQERHFYALIALESLLDSWMPSCPSDNVYVLSHVDSKDRGKEKLLTLMQQFAYGCHLLGAMPTILHGRMFRDHGRGSSGSDPTQEGDLTGLRPVSSVTKSPGYPWSEDQLREAQQSDPALSALFRHLQGDTAFPTDNPLHKLFTRNTLKIGYRCMPNMAKKVKGHNAKSLKDEPTQWNQQPQCKCRGGI